MFDTRHLRTFDKVVRTGSYAAAARELGYTQPAVGQQMKALERIVGTALFQRVRQHLRLTEAGEVLARHAALILEDMADARQQLDAFTGLSAGRVRMCVVPAAAAALVPAALARLAAGHPEIRVMLQEDGPSECLGRITRGEYDIALVPTCPGRREEVPGDLEETPLAEDRAVVLLRGGHRLAGRPVVRLGELEEERWITGCPRSAARLPHEYAEPGPAPVTSFTADDTLMVQSLVAEGLGIAMVPRSVLPFLAHGEIVGRPLEPAVRWQVSAYTIKEHLRMPAVALVLDELRAAAAPARAAAPRITAGRECSDPDR